MVQVNVLGGYDNVTFPQPWTDQLITNPGVGGALESSGAGNSLGAISPAANSYLSWTLAPEEASDSGAITSTNGWLWRVVAQGGGACGHIDVATVSSTYTNCVFGLYNAASFAVGPLVWTADQHAAFGSAGLVAMTWNGASSPASVNLVAGQTYWVYAELTGTSPVLASSVNPSAAGMNPNLTASATFANNAMTIATGPTSLAANTTLTPQTSWANSGTKAWVGLRA